MPRSNPKNPSPHVSLRNLLRAWTPAAGPDGFEGLVAQALATITGFTFRLARSGSQFGRDGASQRGPFSVAMEAKRYTKSVPLEDLAGKASLAAFDLADDVDVWAIAATVEVSEPTLRKLALILDTGGISLLTLDWSETQLPMLGVALAAARDDVLTWSAKHISKPKLSALQTGLDEIRADAAFADSLAHLRAELSAPTVGLPSFKSSNASWCSSNFADREKAQREFAQYLAPLDQTLGAIGRPKLVAEIDRAFQSALENSSEDVLVAVLGDEGVGKSWAITNWWLQAQDSPILLLSVGRAADLLSAGDPPIEMLARLAALQEERRDEAILNRWRRRFERWSQLEQTGAFRFAVVLDGLNETSGKSWSAVLRALMPSVRALGGVVAVTCRRGYWDREITPRLSHATVERVTVDNYDNEEFAAYVGSHGFKPDEIPPKLNRFMRNPRICTLALTLLDGLSGFEELGVERLLGEYWRARLLERGDLIGHGQADFEELLVRHARDYRARPGIAFKRDEWRRRSGAVERDDGRNLANDLSDIEEGAFFESSSGRYRFRAEAMPFALGLLVADELRDAGFTAEQTASEALEKIIAPVRSFDELSDVLTAAIATAVADGDYPDHCISALISGWMSLQNVGEDGIERLAPYVTQRPEAFLDAFEARASDSGDNRFLELLVLVADRPNVSEAIEERLPRWLSTWSRESDDWGDAKEQEERREKRNHRIDQNLGMLTDEESAYFAANCAELAEPAGMVGFAAWWLLGRRQAKFARAIVAYAFSYAVAADYRLGYEELAWAIHLNRIDHDLLSAAVRSQIEPFKGSGASSVAKSAASHALRLLGTLHDDTEARRLVPPTHYESRHELDPLDPVVEAPDEVEAIAAQVEKLDAKGLWTGMHTTSEDYELDRRLTFLTRYDANGIVSVLDRLAETIATREGLPLRQLAWRLPWLSPILSESTISKVIDRIRDIGANPDLTPDPDFATGMLVEAAFPHLSAEQQLDLLQSLPEEAHYYLRYDALAKPLPSADGAARLREALKDKPYKVERTILFLAASPPEPNEALRRALIECLNHDDADVRGAAKEFIRRHGDPVLDQALLRSPAPDDKYGSWPATVHRSAVASAIGRTGNVGALSNAPMEHIDWIAARVPAALPLLGDAVEASIDRLLGVVQTQNPVLSDMVIDVEDNEIEFRVDLVERKVKHENPFKALSEEMSDEDGSKYSQRRKLINEEHDRFMDGLDHENATMLASRPPMLGLAELANSNPERFRTWLQRILATDDQRVLRRLRNLGTLLAQHFADFDPSLAAATFAHLWRVKPDVNIVIGRAKHPMRDLALFRAPLSDDISMLRAKIFEEARDDSEIETAVLAAQAAGAAAWLEDFVEQRLKSPFPVDQALALTITSFRPPNRQSDELLWASQEGGYIGIAMRIAHERYIRAKRASYWFEEAGKANDWKARWRLIQLGVAAADKRHLVTEASELASSTREFGGDVLQRLRRSAEKSSKEVAKTLFGTRKPSGLLNVRDV
jgi:hypothetical protein